MPKTLLAVDDSATMRKVMEITFSGEDFNVLTAGDKDSALAKAGESPRVVLVDAALDGDGYALAKELRRRLPGAVLVLLSSRYSPYDQAKGKDAGADDFMDKPFDTQQIIDKVKKLVATKEAAGPVAAAPAASPAPPIAAARPVASPPAPAAAAPPPVPAAKPGFTATPAPSRSATLMFPLGAPEAPAPAAPAPPAAAKPAAPAPSPPAAPVAPKPAPAAAPTHAPVAASAAVGAAVNGHLAGKLGDLGLSPEQANAVLALSREVVERVVWEVVPQLAETIIKEEIARLTKEG